MGQARERFHPTFASFNLSYKSLNLLRFSNFRYKTKFGFPFVICARDNKKAAILSGLEARLENETEKEVIQGVEEVKKIAFYRLLDILQHEEAEKLIGGW